MHVNVLIFILFFSRCGHSWCVQGSREEDDLFGGACLWCGTVFLCPHYIIPQGSCHPLAVLRPFGLTYAYFSHNFSKWDMRYKFHLVQDRIPSQSLHSWEMCKPKRPRHDFTACWSTRTSMVFGSKDQSSWAKRMTVNKLKVNYHDTQH